MSISILYIMMELDLISLPLSFSFEFFPPLFLLKNVHGWKIKGVPHYKSKLYPFTNSLVNLNYCENDSCAHMI